MYGIIWLIGLILCIWLMKNRKSKIPEGQISSESLTGNEKLLIWIICIVNPILGGAILYYGWKKKLPTKAKQANHISLWAFLIVIIVGFILVGSGVIKN